MLYCKWCEGPLRLCVYRLIASLDEQKTVQFFPINVSAQKPSALFWLRKFCFDAISTLNCFTWHVVLKLNFILDKIEANMNVLLDLLKKIYFCLMLGHAMFVLHRKWCEALFCLCA